MLQVAESQERRWWRRGVFAMIVAFAIAAAALPGLASAGSANSAYITSPLGGTLASPSQTFTWSNGVGVTNYWLYVGTSLGASNIYNSGQLGNTVHSATANAMPATGQTVYVKLWSKIGGVWQSNSYTYASAQPVIADLTSPLQHAILTSTGPTFTWSAGSGVDAYWLYVGSAPGYSDYFNSSSLPSGTTSVVSSGLPNDGSTVYVRLWSHLAGGGWLFHDYAMTADGAIVPELTPSIIGGLTGLTCTNLFPISALVNVTATNAVAMSLSAGTTGPGSADLLLNATVTSLQLNVNLGAPICPPLGDSITISARLWYKFGAIWYHDDYTFTLTSTL